MEWWGVLKKETPITEERRVPLKHLNYNKEKCICVGRKIGINCLKSPLA